MAITNYAEVQAATANWLDRTDLSARIPEFISMAEAKMNRDLRVVRMIERATAVIGTDNRYSSVPSDFLEVVSYVLADGSRSWELDPETTHVIAEYRDRNDSVGEPVCYALTSTAQGREFEHYPTPKQAYTGTLTYYAKIPALSATNPTNWLLDIAPDAYLYGTLLQAAPYLRDNDQAAVWSDGFQDALAGVMRLDRPKARKLRADPAALVIGRQTYGC